jgi:diguanylate cyclase (GGDEF)-like protein
MMRLITRSDTSLTIGLIVGTVVVFQQPLHFLLDIARDVEERYHLDLLPALTIFTAVFIFNQYRKRQVAKAAAFAASADAARARMRSEELERLMIFGQALANALDLPTLQQALWKHLPRFVHERAFWVLARVSGRWQEVLQDTTHTKQRSMDVMEPMADRAISEEGPSEGRIEGISNAEAVCFPMRAGGEAIGVLGIPGGIALTLEDRKAIGAAAALIAIALRNVQLFRETRDHSVRDRLTGCFNREYCLETLQRELRRAKRSVRPLSIVMFDIDNFKRLNDELGHLGGDEILRAVGAQLTRVLRSTDVACRYGGDEFLIILPDTDLQGAERVAETLRREVATLALAGTGERVFAVTASVGLATAAPGELDATAFIKMADEALYQAKHLGRNRVCAAVVRSSAATSSAPDVQNLIASTSRSAAAGAGTETILVADDEPFAHDLIRRGLEPRGYTILSAMNAADATAIGQAHRGPIHLLLTDVVMPDLLGPDLVQRFRELRPAIKVVYVSGFIGHPAIEPAMLGTGAGFLQKPFTFDALATKVRETLDSAGRLAAPGDNPGLSGMLAPNGDPPSHT